MVERAIVVASFGVCASGGVRECGLDKWDVKEKKFETKIAESKIT